MDVATAPTSALRERLTFAKPSILLLPVSIAARPALPVSLSLSSAALVARDCAAQGHSTAADHVNTPRNSHTTSTTWGILRRP